MTSRRMFKCFALFCLILALPVAAQAQTSRVEGMAIQGDYIKDYTGMYTYTSSVNNVGNLVYGELGINTVAGPLDRAVGAVIGDLWEGKYGTWAIHMREFTPQLGQGDVTSSPSPGAFGGDPNSNTNESFDLMWGRKFGTTSLGLRLNRSYARSESDVGIAAPGPLLLSDIKWDFEQGLGTDPNFARNILGFGGGLGFEMSPTTNFELSVLYQSRTYTTRTETGGTLEDGGPATYQLAARAFWQWQPNIMVIPAFKWSSFDLSTKDSTGTTNDNSLKSWQVGASGDWTLGSNDLFILGATVAQNKVDQQEDITSSGFANGTITETFTPQVFAALETHVNNWLTLRFGANKGAWHSIKTENNSATPAESERIKDSPFNMSLGAGVKVGSLQLDAVLNDNLPQNGLYLFSGAVTDPMFSKVTATYSF